VPLTGKSRTFQEKNKNKKMLMIEIVADHKYYNAPLLLLLRLLLRGGGPKLPHTKAQVIIQST
jgi:hypothetical protein